MKRILYIFIAAFLLTGLAPLNLQAQATSATAKEVMTDKSGTYIYSMARDADKDVAFQIAYADLISKLEESGNADRLDTLRKSVQRLDNEMYNVWRVIVFVDFKNLYPNESITFVASPARGASTASAPAAVENQPKEPAVSQPKPVAEDKTNVATPSPAAAETAPIEKEDEVFCDFYEDPMAPKDAPVAEAATPAATYEGLPSGRLGDTIAHLLEQNTIKGVQNQLEKAKSSMVISQYGSGQSKYIAHAYLVVQKDKKITVYSPLDSQGKRTNYSTGEPESNINGIQLYWFLKR